MSKDEPNKDFPPITPNTYRATLSAGQNFEFVSAHVIFPYEMHISPFPAGSQVFEDYIQEVYEDDNRVFYNKFTRFENSVYERVEGENIGFSTILKNGYTYRAVYIMERRYNGGTSDQNEKFSFTNRVTYTFSVVENKLPLKPWTITSVINRLLDLCEPLRKGEKPRFRLNGMDDLGNIIPEGLAGAGQAAQFDKITAPQFSLTRQTLRECLQEIGKVIHGEPRLRVKKGEDYKLFKTESFNDGKAYIGSNSPEPYDQSQTYYVYIDKNYLKATIESEVDASSPANDDYYLVLDNNSFTGKAGVYEKFTSKDRYYYEVYYDLYASQDNSDVWTMPYTNKSVEWAINNYQTWLDTNAENLVNQLDKLGGVIVEPYATGSKSVRTENQYVRIQDNNMLIATQYPIYTVDKLEYIYKEGHAIKSLDITAYLFEKSEYDTRLSSYSEQYPYSKAFGLYFTQGQKNIGGLNFKVESASSIKFKNFAITNILQQLLGSGYSLPAYPLLTFRITYMPYYNARVAQSKTNYKDFKYTAALIYNQQSNVIESRYYGENLKGVAARLGNVEKSFMYCLKSTGKIPQAGQLYGNDYYISAVATEILPTYVRCTVGISKDFNRISAYIGVPSEKRYYEISKIQAIERNILWREYVVVGNEEIADTESFINPQMIASLAMTFTGGENIVRYHVTRVFTQGYTAKLNPLPVIELPVISSAFGNSISFSWKYEDNYSAGAMSQQIDNSITGGVTGYWQNDVRYTDFYGNVYYYLFMVTNGYTLGNPDTTGRALALPAYFDQNWNPMNNDFVRERSFVSNVKTGESNLSIANTDYAMVMRKDNRESLQINFQIDFVTNTDIIIGSALASYCPAVRASSLGIARLYVFPTELNKFTDHVEAWEKVDLSKLPYVEVTTTVENNRFTVNAPRFPASGKSWAIVTPQSEGEAEQVEDEKGNVSEYKRIIGGDLLIGRNQEVSAGQAFTPIYFTPKREIYDKSVWKNIK